MNLSRRQFIALSGAAACTGVAMNSDAIAERSSSPVESLNAPIHPGAPTLIVRDLDRVAGYYEESIGLGRIDADSDTVRLGADGVVLMVLRKRQGAEREPTGLAGLYHTAFLVPSRADLGAWLRRAIEAKLPFDGAADHLVSESLYLSDPEGNGIEVYADRPRSGWKWNGKIVEMRNSELDVRGILADGAALPTNSRVPGGTRIGHVHMRVGGIPEAEHFYERLLGFDITRRREGATFYATGRYHHHLATNIWESRGSPRRPGTTTGLAILALIAKDGAAFDATAERMLAAGGKRSGSMIAVEDPWGNVVELSKA
jgi:catechol 2,3-dioxygenase